MRLFHALFGLALAASVLAAPRPSLAAGDPDTVIALSEDDIIDWDPASAFATEIRAFHGVYQTLTHYNPPGSETPLSPELALSWSRSDDGNSWTFKLRPNVTFHDGTPMDAAAVKAALDRTIKLNRGAAYIWDGVTSIEAPSPDTVVINTSSPKPIDVIASSQNGAFIYGTRGGEVTPEWFGEGKETGTGPYAITSWTRGEQVVMDQYPGYWGGFQPDQFKRVIVKTVREGSTQLQLLRSGEADFLSVFPPTLIASTKSDPSIKVDIFPSWKNTFIMLNVKKGPTANLKFRQALTHVIDFVSALPAIYPDGVAERATTIIPVDIWGHAPQPELTYDLDEARRLIEESGVPANERKLTLAYTSALDDYQNLGLLLQSALSQVGVTLDLQPGPWTTVWDKAKHLETAPNLQLLNWWPVYATPGDWLASLFRTEDPINFNLSHYSNPEFDKAVNEGLKLEGVDREKAAEAYATAQHILYEDAVVIPIVDLKTYIAHSASIEGLTYNPAYDSIPFASLRRAKQ